MKSSCAITNIFLPLILLVTLSSAFVACEPSITIRVHNGADEALQVFFGDTLIGTAIPGEELKFETMTFNSPYPIIAKNREGNIIYSKTFTDADLRRIKYRVVIPRGEKELRRTDNFTGK